MGGGGGPSGGSSVSSPAPASIAPELKPLVTASTAGTIAAQKLLPLTGTPQGTYYDPWTGMPVSSPYGPLTSLNPMQVPGLTPMEQMIGAEMSAWPFAMDPNTALQMTPLSTTGQTGNLATGPPVTTGTGGGGSGGGGGGGSPSGTGSTATNTASTAPAVRFLTPQETYAMENGMDVIPGAYLDANNRYVVNIPGTSASASASSSAGGGSGSGGGGSGSGGGSGGGGTGGGAPATTPTPPATPNPLTTRGFTMPGLNPEITRPFDIADQAALDIMGPLNQQADYLAMKDNFTSNIAPLVESTSVGKGYSPTSGAMLESLSNAASNAVLPLAEQQQQLKSGLVSQLPALAATETGTVMDALKSAESAAALPRTQATTQAQSDYNAFQQLMDFAKQLTLGPTQTILPAMVTPGAQTTTTSQPSGFSK